MKPLLVEGIEEIEITDPAGLCNPPVPQLPSGFRAQPSPVPPPTTPYDAFQASGTFGRPFPLEPLVPDVIPGRIRPPERFRPQVTKTVPPSDDRSKWGVGGEVIRQAGKEIGKWEKNWNSSVGGSRTDGD
ncbi:hypothetical protein LCGC14_1475470 [marine sediment metagenome]|uniref:Uncharacterized protein n=1 Tax=marine sediment metagenome TaxID=412755 RepID=A0A0F9MCT5_9ZZZZ